MNTSIGTAEIGQVLVQTTVNRGFTPEEIAERALAKMLYVGENSHPTIHAQALAFKEQLRHVLVHYLREAQMSERTNIAVTLRNQGHADVAASLFN